MSGITVVTRTVYVIEKHGRLKSYFSMKSAANALARLIIEKRYPTEHQADEPDTGYCHPGWYWKDQIHRADVLHRRLARMIITATKAAPK